jgi:S-disulfanyl-L-cysteine oxidoreductase SoxD
MFSSEAWVAGMVMCGLLMSGAVAHDFGRPVNPDEIKLWDIDVRPDGSGLPGSRCSGL